MTARAIQMAIEAAIKRDDHRAQRIGCAIVRKDGVIVAFANMSDVKQNPRLHAEARCARKATPESTAYVVRILRDSSLALAKPCPYCQLRLRAHGVQTVVYSINGGTFERMSL